MGNEEPEERIVRYTAEELAEKRRRGETLSNWKRVDALTEEELQASIDFQEEGDNAWDITYIGPGPEFTEAIVAFRCDADVFDWFEQHDDNPEGRIAEVLSEHVEVQMSEEMDFEWDEEKRRTNIIKHGFDFLRARAIFDGRPRVDTDSSVPHEPRMVSIAILDGAYVAVIWTERNDKLRLISVRHARRGERTLFHRKTGIRPGGAR
jgi:uncharacterized DUF497 family protein